MTIVDDLSREDLARLDNPVHAALTGPHVRFAQHAGAARRYDPEVAPFLALPDVPAERDWQDARRLLIHGPAGATVRPPTAIPSDWTIGSSFGVVQMCDDGVDIAEDPEAVLLDAHDAPDMVALAHETNPGPFLPRTFELGAYYGIRRDQQLIAMAGERLALPGWTEISAVCTAPTHRGQGLASRLVSTVIAGIQHRGDRAFLHVTTTNTSAIRLYETLGFRTRRELTVTVLTRAARPERTAPTERP